MREKSFCHRHAVVLYFVLVFLFSWIGAYLVAGTRFLEGAVPELSDIGLIAIAVLGGPFVVGILMTYLADGREGLRGLFSRMRRWRLGARWYLPIAIFPILLGLVLLALSIGVSPEFITPFVVPFVFSALIVGFLEETGWMGFAFPRMNLRRSTLGTALLLGLIHAVWHLFPDFISNFGSMGGLYWVLTNIGFFTHVVALRILIVWLYTNTESLLLAILMHASSTGFYGFFTANLANVELRAIFFLVYGAVLWLPAIVVILKYGKTLKA